MQVSCQRRDELEGVSTGIYWLQQEAEWRGYDDALGRFTQPDTIVPTGTQGTQAWDRYAFVNNNPVRYNDPTGHGVDCGIGEGCMGNQTNPNDPPAELTSDSVSGDDEGSDNKRKKTSEKHSSTQNDLPSTIIMHPLDGNVESLIPIYGFYNGQLVIIGYTETYYAFDYSSIEFNANASGTIPWLIPTVYEAVKWGFEKAGLKICLHGSARRCGLGQ